MIIIQHYEKQLNYIFEDPKFPELYLLYAKNRLTDNNLADFTSAFPKQDLKNEVLQSGDKSLIKEVAIKTGFNGKDFEKAIIFFVVFDHPVFLGSAHLCR